MYEQIYTGYYFLSTIFGNYKMSGLLFLFSPSVYPCDSSPCKNGGTCGNDETEFTCECTEQFEGPTCETEGIYTAF